MKNIILISLVWFYCTFFSFAQIGQNAIIEYQQLNNTDSPNTYFTTLSIDGQTSIFQEKYSTTIKNKTQEQPGVYTKHFLVDFDPYLKTDLKNKEILFYEMMGRNTFLIKDSYSNLKWDITSENKEVAGYKCIKAITSYRGRTWQVWFTPEIALPFGPWKLHGLPGLILEASDISNRYAFKVVKIEFKKSELFEKDFNNLMAAYNKKPVSYQQFLVDREEYRDNAYKEISQKQNITVERNKPLPTGMETKFEWNE